MSSRLDVRGLTAGYGGGVVVRGVDLVVESGEVHAVIGRNGVGKTTLANALMGIVPPSGGSVRLGDRELGGQAVHHVARAGLAIVPQGRGIFAGLSVEENLEIATVDDRGGWSIDRVYKLLPRLKERCRLGGQQLSGGEQQMLSLGRALLRNPDVLLLDEPSEGLAPLMIQEIADILRELRDDGLGMLLVEQNLKLAFDLADHVSVMVKGEIVHRAPAGELRTAPDRVQRLLGAGEAIDRNDADQEG